MEGAAGVCGPEELSEAQVLTGGSPPTRAEAVRQLVGPSFLQVGSGQEESPKTSASIFCLESPALAMWPKDTDQP